MTDTVEAETLEKLRDLTSPTPDHLVELHRRLEIAAENNSALDLSYTVVDSPVGPLLLAATSTGLVRVAYEREGFDEVLDTLAAKLGPRILRSESRLAAAAAQIGEYFAGRRTDFDLDLDYSLSSGFRQVVQRHLSDIPYGRTESYRDVARIVGNPNASRAVGTACATNPLPVVVPCHRVLRTDGTLGGYIGGLEAKTTLLSLEAAA